tara:strand:- start:2412 stop:3176 length:765 start_codon:yes stop_codon:yes gene_type:complete
MTDISELHNDILDFLRSTKSTELEGAALVARLIDPSFNLDFCLAELKKIAQNWEDGIDPWIILQGQGFSGFVEEPDVIAGSRLDLVLRDKVGIPISLGVLLIELCRMKAITVDGINFPGHFLVRVEDRLINPTSMQIVSKEDCLDQLDPRMHKQAFEIANPKTIFLRMLNNIKYHYIREELWESATRIIEAQILGRPNDPFLLAEQGDLWVKVGAVGVAKELLMRALSHAEPGSELSRVLHERLKCLPQDPQIH